MTMTFTMSLATAITDTNTAHNHGARTYINPIAIADVFRIGIIKITISMEIMFTITNMATITIIMIIITIVTIFKSPN